MKSSNMLTATAAADDIPRYLTPNFDANSLTINDLVGILLDHNVAVPPVKAKKEVYVGLFETHVAPKRDKFIAELSLPVQPSKPQSPPSRHRVTNTSDTNVESARKRKPAAGSATPQPAKSTATPQSIGLTLVGKDRTVDLDENDVNFSDDNPFQSGGEESPDKKQHKVKRRKAIAPPPGTASGVQFLSDDDGNSIKARRNVIVSEPSKAGSSPLPFMFKSGTPDVNFAKNTDTIFGTDSKRDVSSSNSKKKALKTLTRRKATKKAWTDDEGGGAADDSTGRHGDEGWRSVLPSPAALSSTTMNASATTQMSGNPPITIRSALKKASPRSKAAVMPSSEESASIWLSMSIVLSLFFLAHWFYTVKDTLQFCESNDSSPETVASEVIGWNPLLKILPTCIKCPSNAVCVGKTVLSCQIPEHALQPNFVSELIPGVPFPFDIPSCEVNKHKLAAETQQAQLVDRGVLHLDQVVRTWIGKAQCNELSAEAARNIPSWAKENGRVWGMPPAEAKRQLRRSLGPKWSIDRFEEYWDLLLRRINPSGNGQRAPTPVKTEFDKTGRFLALLSSSEPIISFSCRIKSSIFQTIRAYSVHLTLMGIVAAFAALWYEKSVNAAREAKMVEVLVEDVLDSIAQAAEHHIADPDRFALPGISVDQLRDHLLPVPIFGTGFASRLKRSQETSKDSDGRTRWHLNDDASRQRLWSQVSHAVLRNSMVRETSMEVKGEMHTIWQWIGSDVLSPRRPASSTNAQSNNKPVVLGAFGTPVVPALAKRLSSGSAGSSHDQLTEVPSAAVGIEKYPVL